MAGYPGKQGRKPVPTALKLLRGNPGKRALNADEPVGAPKLEPPPKELSDGAKREWRRTGRKLLAARIITDLDTAIFAAYCSSYARWLELTALLVKSSPLVRDTKGGLMPNPLHRLIDQAQEQYTRALAEFGMSPVSRSRVHAATAPAEQADPFEAFLRGS